MYSTESKHIITLLQPYSLPTEFNIDVAWLVHAVGGGQDNVFSEDGSSAEPSVLLVQEESLQGWNKTKQWILQSKYTKSAELEGVRMKLKNDDGKITV